MGIGYIYIYMNVKHLSRDRKEMGREGWDTWSVRRDVGLNEWWRKEG